MTPHYRSRIQISYTFFKGYYLLVMRKFNTFFILDIFFGTLK